MLGKNKIEYLNKLAFAGLRNLKLLNLLGNNIVFLDHSVFSNVRIKTILTDDFHVCCINFNQKTTCTAKPLWPSSCDVLLSGVGLKVASWLLGILIILFNFMSIMYAVVMWHKTSKLKSYSKYVILINSCDITVGLYMLTLAVKDAILAHQYVESDIVWRSSVECHAIAFTSLWSLLMEALFLLTMSIIRFRIVKDPFTKPQRKNSARTVVVVLPLLFAVLISVAITLRHKVEKMQKLSSPLCLIVGKTDHSLTQTVVTVIVPVFLMIILLVTFAFYMKLLSLNRSKELEVVLNKEKRQERKKAMTKSVVLVGITNALCWIPVSVFYLVSVFLSHFPVVLMYWITLVVLPINPVVNPIIFNLSNIKDEMKSMTAECNKRKIK